MKTYVSISESMDYSFIHVLIKNEYGDEIRLCELISKEKAKDISVKFGIEIR